MTKSYGRFTAVDSISFDIPEGDTFGFLGPNGAGKTTTIRMLTGLSRPSSGEIFLDGEKIDFDDHNWKRKIGVVSDTLSLFEGLTIDAHFELVGPIYGLSAEETHKRKEELLQFLNLKKERKTYIKEASHGMKKKLALALALLHNPKILFLDEALSGIDPVTGSHIRNLLKKMSLHGTTLFITSHTLEVIEPMINLFAIISGGRIIKTGSTADFKEKSLEQIFIDALEIDTKLPELSWLF